MIAESRIEFFGGEITCETYGDSPFGRVWKEYDGVPVYYIPQTGNTPAGDDYII